MSRPLCRWPLLVLLLLVAGGCASESFPLHPAVAPAGPTAQSSAPEPAEPMVLPPAVDENRAFLTLDGVARYRIGPGDILDIVLTRELALDKMSAVVKTSGKVSIGFFEAAVGGLTTEQAEREIQRVLAPTHRQLTVEVTIKTYASKTVSVLGEVQRLGVFPLKGRTNLVDLLAEAGGVTATADPRAIRLLRKDGQSYTINLFRLVSEEQRFREVILDAGDVVFVPRRAPDEQLKVFVLGEVRTPGVYPFTPNIRVSQALAMAGGPTHSAVLESVRVVRGDLRNNPQIVEVYAGSFAGSPDRSQDIVLQSNDLIVIPRSRIGDWNAFLAQLRPTLEFVSLPFTSVTNYFILKDLLK